MHAVLKGELLIFATRKYEVKAEVLVFLLYFFCKQKRQSIIMDGSSQLVDFNQSA